jgi:hypothetical protein
MIKPTFVVMLFGVLVLMALGFVLIHSDRPVPTSGQGGSKKLATFDVTTVESIAIKKNDVAVTIAKKDKQWIMTSHKNRPVKAERVDMLLSNLNIAKINRECLGTPSAFDLDDANRTQLTLDQGSAKIEMTLGKTAEPFRAFVRKGESEPIL